MHETMINRNIAPFHKDIYEGGSPPTHLMETRRDTLLEQRRRAARTNRQNTQHSNTAERRARQHSPTSILPPPRKLNLEEKLQDTTTKSLSRGRNTIHSLGPNISFQALPTAAQTIPKNYGQQLVKDEKNMAVAPPIPEHEPASRQSSEPLLEPSSTTMSRTPYLASLKTAAQPRVFGDTIARITNEVDAALDAMEKENLLLRFNVKQLTMQITQLKEQISAQQTQQPPALPETVAPSPLPFLPAVLTMSLLSPLTFTPPTRQPLQRAKSSKSVRTVSTQAQTEVSSSDLVEFEDWRLNRHQYVKSADRLETGLSSGKPKHEEVKLKVVKLESLKWTPRAKPISKKASIVVKNFSAVQPKRRPLVMTLLRPIEIEGASFEEYEEEEYEEEHEEEPSDDDFEFVSSPKKPSVRVQRPPPNMSNNKFKFDSPVLTKHLTKQSKVAPKPASPKKAKLLLSTKEKPKPVEIAPEQQSKGSLASFLKFGSKPKFQPISFSKTLKPEVKSEASDEEAEEEEGEEEEVEEIVEEISEADQDDDHQASQSESMDDVRLKMLNKQLETNKLLLKEKQKLEIDMSALQKQLEQITSEKDELSTSLESAHEEIETLKTENSNLKDKLKEKLANNLIALMPPQEFKEEDLTDMDTTKAPTVVN